MNESQNDEHQIIKSPKYGAYEAGKLLLLRIFATALSIYVLWINADNGKAFFSTLFVFSVSQLLYALSLKSLTVMRKIISLVILAFIGILAFMSFVGLSGGGTISSTDVGDMVVLVKSTQQLYLFRSESFAIGTGIILVFFYTVEWGTSWSALPNKLGKPKYSSANDRRGRD